MKKDLEESLREIREDDAKREHALQHYDEHIAPVIKGTARMLWFFFLAMLLVAAFLLALAFARGTVSWATSVLILVIVLSVATLIKLYKEAR